MSIKAVLFDLDDTLVHDQATYKAATETAWRDVVGTAVDPDELYRTLRRQSRKRWEVSPSPQYCQEIGLFPLACLVSGFPGDSVALGQLRGWGPGYREAVWTKVSSRHGAPKALAPALAERFAAAVFAGARPMDGAIEAVEGLAGRYRLAVVTNGAADLQRAKLASARLGSAFDFVAISTEVGYGKPDARVFQHVLRALGVQAGEAVHVGDNPENDIRGASEAGLQPIWFRHSASSDHPEGVPALTRLQDLPGLIASLSG
jgi:putative hydrolase of the HAD superfamily